MMKSKIYILAFVSVATCLIGCAPKDEKETVIKEMYYPTSWVAQGTETHGGDVLRARALKLRDELLLTQAEIDLTWIGNEVYKPKEFKAELKSLMWGLRLTYRQLPAGGVKRALEHMFFGDAKGDIFEDIDRSVYDVKVYIPPTETDPTKPIYANCMDHGLVSTAGAKLNDRGGVICFDARRLAQEGSEQLDLLALALHEHAHHFGYDEDITVELQKLVYNIGYVSSIGDLAKRSDYLNLWLDNSVISNNVFEVEVEVFGRVWEKTDYACSVGKIRDTSLAGSFYCDHTKYVVPTSVAKYSIDPAMLQSSLNVGKVRFEFELREPSQLSTWPDAFVEIRILQNGKIIKKNKGKMRDVFNRVQTFSGLVSGEFWIFYDLN